MDTLRSAFNFINSHRQEAVLAASVATAGAGLVSMPASKTIGDEAVQRRVRIIATATFLAGAIASVASTVAVVRQHTNLPRFPWRATGITLGTFALAALLGHFGNATGLLAHKKYTLTPEQQAGPNGTAADVEFFESAALADKQKPTKKAKPPADSIPKMTRLQRAEQRALAKRMKAELAADLAAGEMVEAEELIE